MSDPVLRSPNLSLDLLAPAQAQKHVIVNEAMLRLDALVQLRLDGIDMDEPPAPDRTGQVVATSATPSGDFSAHPHSLAIWTEGGWRFQPLHAGTLAYELNMDSPIVWTGQAWVTVSTQLTPPPDSLPRLGLGASASETHPLVVEGSGSLFSHGSSAIDHRLAINRSSPSDTASCIFQTGFSGGAEIGLIGDTGLSLQTSLDGTSWHRHAIADPTYPGLIAPALRSGKQSVAHEAVIEIVPPSSGGIVAIIITDDSGFPQTHHSCLMAYDTGGSPAAFMLANMHGVRNMGATILTGTTGTDGMTNIAVKTGAIIIENRFDQDRTYSWMFLC